MTKMYFYFLLKKVVLCCLIFVCKCQKNINKKKDKSCEIKKQVALTKESQTTIFGDKGADRLSFKNIPPLTLNERSISWIHFDVLYSDSQFLWKCLFLVN